MKAVKLETSVTSHSTQHMAKVSFSDSEKEVFWPIEQVCMNMCVCECVCARLFTFFYKTDFSSTTNVSSRTEHIWMQTHSNNFTVWSISTVFTKCLLIKRPLSLSKLPLAEIINEEEEGRFRRRRRSAASVGQTECSRVSILLSNFLLPIYSYFFVLFSYQCFQFLILFLFIFLLQTFPSPLST
jgi:hypothetical protein